MLVSQAERSQGEVHAAIVIQRDAVPLDEQIEHEPQSPLFYWMLDFSLAPIFLLASDQERSNSATLLPRFSLALVGFLDVQSFQMSTQERCFALIVRLKFQIAWYIS